MIMHELPSYDISYEGKPHIFTYIDHLTSSRTAINAEYTATKKILNDRSIDLIISDHRLGVRSDQVRSIFMAHQLVIPFNSGIIRKTASYVQSRFIARFDECWIPDYPEEPKQLSGRLTHMVLPIPKTFIGPLSRFDDKVRHHDQQESIDILVLLSGVEPDRTQLESKLYDILSSQDRYKVQLVRGTSNPRPESMTRDGSSIVVHDLLNTDELEPLLTETRLVIARSGFSTIMDLHVLRKKAIYIPSRYQPEQLYLGKIVHQYEGASCLLEEDMTTQSLFTEVKRHLGPSK